MAGRLIQRLKQHRDMTIAFRQSDEFRPIPAPYQPALIQRNDALGAEPLEDDLQLSPANNEATSSIQRSPVKVASGNGGLGFAGRFTEHCSACCDRCAGL